MLVSLISFASLAAWSLLHDDLVDTQNLLWLSSAGAKALVLAVDARRIGRSDLEIIIWKQLVMFWK